MWNKKKNRELEEQCVIAFNNHSECDEMRAIMQAPSKKRGKR